MFRNRWIGPYILVLGLTALFFSVWSSRSSPIIRKFSEGIAYHHRSPGHLREYYIQPFPEEPTRVWSVTAFPAGSPQISAGLVYSDENQPDPYEYNILVQDFSGENYGFRISVGSRERGQQRRLIMEIHSDYVPEDPLEHPPAKDASLIYYDLSMNGRWDAMLDKEEEEVSVYIWIDGCWQEVEKHSIPRPDNGGLENAVLRVQGVEYHFVEGRWRIRDE